MISAITPYLFFSGRCDEALQFYRVAMDAKIESMLRYSESPDPIPDGMLQEGFENKIMHASFTVGNIRLMASDGCDDKSTLHGFQLCVSVDGPETARRVFDALAHQGVVQMPLAKTFWSPCFGMLQDQFNVVWMIMVPPEDACAES